ncbi:MAG: hypothetical protein PHV30_03805 [Candidatus Margulisbacteria bacterium]|nr:hypothetical protein [Candidatus Margulisiibacteriota bacterium]
MDFKYLMDMNTNYQYDSKTGKVSFDLDKDGKFEADEQFDASSFSGAGMPWTYGTDSTGTVDLICLDMNKDDRISVDELAFIKNNNIYSHDGNDIGDVKGFDGTGITTFNIDLDGTANGESDDYDITIKQNKIKKTSTLKTNMQNFLNGLLDSIAQGNLDELKSFDKNQTAKFFQQIDKMITNGKISQSKVNDALSKMVNNSEFTDYFKTLNADDQRLMFRNIALCTNDPSNPTAGSSVARDLFSKLDNDTIKSMFTDAVKDNANNKCVWVLDRAVLETWGSDLANSGNSFYTKMNELSASDSEFKNTMNTFMKKLNTRVNLEANENQEQEKAEALSRYNKNHGTTYSSFTELPENVRKVWEERWTQLNSIASSLKGKLPVDLYKTEAA